MSLVYVNLDLGDGYALGEWKTKTQTPDYGKYTSVMSTPESDHSSSHTDITSPLNICIGFACTISLAY